MQTDETPPTTTTSAILQQISWASNDVSLRPPAPLNIFTQKWNKSSKGSGPDARPPKVFNGAPAGLILARFHLGT